MDVPLSLLEPGRMVVLHLVGGMRRRGVVMALGDGWLHLLGEQGAGLVNLAQAVAIDLDGEQAPVAPLDAALPKPVSNDVPFKVGGRAPGRPWQDADLKALADGFLDNRPDAEIAARFHRTRGQVKELRQGFECARGNLVEDQLGPVARTWVARWRRVLAGQQ